MWHNNPSQEASIHAGLGIPELTGTISSNTVAAMQDSVHSCSTEGARSSSRMLGRMASNKNNYYYYCIKQGPMYFGKRRHRLGS